MVELKSVVKTYTVCKTQVEALKGVSLSLKEGDFVTIEREMATRCFWPPES